MSTIYAAQERALTRENYGQAADNSELEEDRKWFGLQLQRLLVVLNILHLEII